MSGLILTGCVGKHTDSLAQELVTSTEGKTDCKEWGTDGWEGYKRVLPDEVDHYIGKALTQREEANQRHCASTDRTLASTTKQIRQGLGAFPW